MAIMRVAQLWSSVANGTPVLAEALGRAGETTPRNDILAFLRGGSEVMRAAGYSEDWLVPDTPLVVPIGFRTDGTWLWSEELAYYLREHGIVPESAFVGHMAAHRFAAESASDSAIATAEQLLRGTT